MPTMKELRTFTCPKCHAQTGVLCEACGNGEHCPKCGRGPAVSHSFHALVDPREVVRASEGIALKGE